MSVVVEARELTTSYGRQRARGIVAVDLDLDAGEVLGLVGENGAGKSTLMRTMLDFVRPTSGRVALLGMDSRIQAVAIRRRTTYLPGELIFPSRMTGRAVIARYLAARNEVSADRVDDLADQLHLDLDRTVADLSKGNRQKLGLVLAFAPYADLLVLDEPTSGLDPVLQQQFAQLVRAATERGASVLLSSHVMAEVEQVAHRVALLRDGRVVSVDPLHEVLARGLRRGTARPHHQSDADLLAAELGRTPGISDVQSEHDPTGGTTIRFAVTGDVNAMLSTLARHRLDSFDLVHADLEDAFFASDTEDVR